MQIDELISYMHVVPFFCPPENVFLKQYLMQNVTTRVLVIKQEIKNRKVKKSII